VYAAPRLNTPRLKLRRVGTARQHNQLGDGALNLGEILNSNGWKSNNSKALRCRECHPASSRLKRGIVATWHKVSAKHLPDYLDEMVFRFNNRKNRFLFRDTMLKLIDSPNFEYKHLTAKVQDAG
jgi:ISXO2-like transposase domain